MDKLTLIFLFCCIVCGLMIVFAAWTGYQIARFESRLEKIERRYKHEVRKGVLDISASRR